VCRSTFASTNRCYLQVMKMSMMMCALLASGSHAAAHDEQDTLDLLEQFLDEPEALGGDLDAGLASTGESRRRRRHRHGPHGHNPHIHTPYPTVTPTPSPTTNPTSYPTPSTNYWLGAAGSTWQHNNCGGWSTGVCPSAVVNTVVNNQVIFADTTDHTYSEGLSVDISDGAELVLEDNVNFIIGTTATFSPTASPTPVPTATPTPAPTAAPTPAGEVDLEIALPNWDSAVEVALQASLAQSFGVEGSMITFEKIYDDDRRLVETFRGFKIRCIIKVPELSLIATIKKKVENVAAFTKEIAAELTANGVATSIADIGDIDVGYAVVDIPGATSFPTKTPTSFPTSAPTPAPTTTPTPAPTYHNCIATQDQLWQECPKWSGMFDANGNGVIDSVQNGGSEQYCPSANCHAILENDVDVIFEADHPLGVGSDGHSDGMTLLIMEGSQLDIVEQTIIIGETGTANPTPSPTPAPTPGPTAYPTPVPTAYPTPEPTPYPTPYPTP